MIRFFPPLLIALVTLVGCSTPASFAVLDELAVGMEAEEVTALMETYGLIYEESADRPETGWPTEEDNFVAFEARAGWVEGEEDILIAHGEVYAGSHGLLGLGFGYVYLFYDESGFLVSWYRYQIN